MLDSWPGEKLLMRIWDTFEKGIGSAFRPYQLKREERARAHARRDEMLLIAQTEKDIEDIRAGRKSFNDRGQLIASAEAKQTESSKPVMAQLTGDQPSWLEGHNFVAAAQCEVWTRELQRLLNLSKVRIYAEEEAEGVPDEEVSDKPIDPDWFIRWREGAQDVSAEELQRLWARILSGELKQPGSYTIHTLDFLRRMSREDAKIIQRIAPFVIDHFIWNTNLGKWRIDYSILLDLEEMGIINGASGIGLSVTLPSASDAKFEKLIKCHQKSLLISSDNPKALLRLEAHKLTRIGRELLSLGRFDANLEYLMAAGQEIKSKGFAVQLCDYRPAEENHVLLFNCRDL